MRVTSCAGVDLADVDIQNREVIVRKAKGGREYLTFFTPGCALALEEYIKSARPLFVRKECAALFLSCWGKRLNRSLIRQMLVAVVERAELRKHVHPHLLRHFLCTTLLERGMNLRAVAEIAGHTSLNTTAGYAEVTVDLMRKTIREAHPRGTL